MTDLVERLNGRAKFFEDAPADARQSDLVKSSSLYREAATTITRLRAPASEGEVEEVAIAICKNRCFPGEDWRVWWCKSEHREPMLLDARAALSAFLEGRGK